MATVGVIELTTATSHAVDSVIPVGDVHDATQAPQGSLRKMTLASLFLTAVAMIVSIPYRFTQVWNQGGTTFNLLDLNPTDTASASTSSYLQCRVSSGLVVYSILKDGTIQQGNALWRPPYNVRQAYNVAVAIGFGVPSRCTRVIVAGDDILSAGTARFVDEVSFWFTSAGDKGMVVISSTTLSGAPNVRTYSVDNSGNFMLQLSSATLYSVRAVPVEL